MSESVFDGIPTVPVASETGAQPGRETPKQRKAKMLAEMRASKKAADLGVPAEVLDFEKAHGISVPDKQNKPDPSSADDVPDVVAVAPVIRRRHRRVEASGATQKRSKMVVSIFITGAGEYRTPAYGVVEAGEFGLFLLLPSGSDEAIFIPSAGSLLTLKYRDPVSGNVSVPCYYPGVAADIPGLDAYVVALIKADSSSVPET